MTSTPERLPVAFAGEGSGEEELAWGQKENWSAVATQKTWLPLGGVKPLDPGTELSEIAEELQYLMGRYQVLRTLLLFDEPDRPRQRVYAEGETYLEIYEVGVEYAFGTGADADALAELVLTQYRDTLLDFAVEWPIRMAVVRDGARLTHMVVLMSHFALDAAGAAVMMAEVAVRESTPVSGLTPLAQAAWQKSPAGVRHNAAAMRYWEGVLRTVPPRRFPVQPEVSGPRYWYGVFRAPVLLPAVRLLAADSGLESSTVLFAMYALGVRAFAQVDPVVIRPIVGNRFRPGHAGVVCTIAQAGLCSFDLAGLSFPQALAQVNRDLMTAYKYSYFNHEDMVAVRDRVGRERGEAIETGCYFNDRRSPATKQEAGPAQLSWDQARAQAGPSTFEWVAGHDVPIFDPLFVHVDDVPDAIQLSVHIDLKQVSKENAEQMAQVFEREALAAADAAAGRLAEAAA